MGLVVTDEASATNARSFLGAVFVQHRSRDVDIHRDLGLELCPSELYFSHAIATICKLGNHPEPRNIRTGRQRFHHGPSLVSLRLNFLGHSLSTALAILSREDKMSVIMLGKSTRSKLSDLILDPGMSPNESIELLASRL